MYTGLAPWQWAVYFVLVLVAQAMITALSLRVAQGAKASWSELWDAAREFTFPLLGLSILVGLSIILGFICFIVPGIIMIRRTFLAAYVLIDQKVGIIEAIRRSAALSKPFSGAVWGLIGVSILMQVPGAAIFGTVGSIIGTLLGFAYTVAPALRYVELKKLSA